MFVNLRPTNLLHYLVTYTSSLVKRQSANIFSKFKTLKLPDLV